MARRLLLGAPCSAHLPIGLLVLMLGFGTSCSFPDMTRSGSRIPVASPYPRPPLGKTPPAAIAAPSTTGSTTGRSAPDWPTQRPRHRPSSQRHRTSASRTAVTRRVPSSRGEQSRSGHSAGCHSRPPTPALLLGHGEGRSRGRLGPADHAARTLARARRAACCSPSVRTVRVRGG